MIPTVYISDNYQELGFMSEFSQRLRLKDVLKMSTSTATEIGVDVVIVGAGVSGLTAAYKLLQHNNALKLVVLEAKDRVGGRTWTTTLQGCNGPDTWDLGGQWIGRNQFAVMALLSELDIEMFPQNSTGMKFMRLGENRKSQYRGKIPGLSVISMIYLQLLIWQVESMSSKLSLDPHDEPTADERAWDGMTVQSFLKQHLWTEESLDAISVALGTIFGCDASEVSVLYMLRYLKASGGWGAVVESGKGSNQEFRIKGGAQLISHKLRKLIEEFEEARVVLESPVDSVSQDDQCIRFETRGETNVVYIAKYAIIAIPPHLLAAVNFTPSLPRNKQHLLQKLPVGHTIKFIITYTLAFWRTDFCSGEIVTSRGFRDSKNPIELVYDGTSSSGSPALIGFITGERARFWAQQESEDRRGAVLSSIASYFGVEALDPIDYRDIDWSQVPYNGGCPVSFMAPGAGAYNQHLLSTPHLRVHWAGTETSTTSTGFIDGAIISGQRAAERVGGLLTGPHKIIDHNLHRDDDTITFNRSHIATDYSNIIYNCIWCLVLICLLYNMYLIMSYVLDKSILPTIFKYTSEYIF